MLSRFVEKAASAIGLKQEKEAPDREATDREGKIAVLKEKNFPSTLKIDEGELTSALASHDYEYLDVEHLAQELLTGNYRVFVNPYGAHFPKSAWRTIHQFLDKGGSWVNLGGAPFTLPVYRALDEWKAECPQPAYHNELNITHFSPYIPPDYVGLGVAEGIRFAPKAVGGFDVSACYHMQIRLSDSSDAPGATAAPDAVVRPLIQFSGDGVMEAAPVVQVDRLSGSFAGGRWILANVEGAVPMEFVRVMIRRALRGPKHFWAHPGYACYRPGEQARIFCHLHKPRGDVAPYIREEMMVKLYNTRGIKVRDLTLTLQGEGSRATGEITVPMDAAPRGGLYRLRIVGGVGATPEPISYDTGFWLYDEKRMSTPGAVECDAHHFTRSGIPFPIVGTTYMSSETHRRFLFQPNPARWHEDMKRISDCGINTIRTGLWTGWRQAMWDVARIDEAFLRAVEAFVLTAKEQKLFVIFTLFAFVPEDWDGENPYLHPRSLEAQRLFVELIAERLATAEDVSWDLISEPSISRHLWQCLPNGDTEEARTWRSWLDAKVRRELPRFRSVRDEVRERWRTTPREMWGLPESEDFQDQRTFSGRHPIKSMDFGFFSQQVFKNWIRDISAAIRRRGNPNQLITVGQDEGGLRNRPNPQIFWDVVDYVSMHNWWNDENLLWDSLMARHPKRALLMNETGVRQAEDIDRRPLRTDEDARNLLERKIAYSIGVNAGGVVQWLWNTNPYVESDAEAAIGLLRADGSAKPEFRVLTGMAGFFSRNQLAFGGFKTGEGVLMVIPHAQMFSPRDQATRATRQAVRAFCFHGRRKIEVVSEHTLSGLFDKPEKARLILLPSPRLVTGPGWGAVTKLVSEGGATLVTSGFLESDGYWRPKERVEEGIEPRVVSLHEFIDIGGELHRIGFSQGLPARPLKGVQDGQAFAETKVKHYKRGKGRVVWSPLPLELGDNPEATAAFYELACSTAELRRDFTVDPEEPGILAWTKGFEAHVLFTVISEIGVDMEVEVTDHASGLATAVTVPAQRAVMVLVNRKSGKVEDAYNVE